MSDTPRTSEEWKRLQRDEATGRYSSKVKYGDLAHGMSAFAKQLERELAEVTKQRDELIKQSAYPIETMVNRFLSWQLPESVCADLCATTPKEGRYGTNLLSASEAKEMIEHLLGVKIQIEESVTNDTVIVKGGSHDDA